MSTSRRAFVLANAGVLATAFASRAPKVSAQDASAGKLIVFGDIVQGTRNLPEEQRADRACVLSSRFPRNSEVVWRTRVIDPMTTEPMDDTMLEKVEVTLSDGQVFEMQFGPHPPEPNPPRDYYWATNWIIPKDYPTGTFTYTVTASDAQGRTGEFKPFDLPPSLPSVTEEVLADVAPPEPEGTPES